MACRDCPMYRACGMTATCDHDKREVVRDRSDDCDYHKRMQARLAAQERCPEVSPREGFRRVRLYKWFQPKADSSISPIPAATKEPDGFGYFHDFGLDFEQMEFGVGTYSVALVETLHGEVRSIPVDLIEFIDPPA